MSDDLRAKIRALKHHRAKTFKCGVHDIGGVLDSHEDGVYVNLSELEAVLSAVSPQTNVVTPLNPIRPFQHGFNIAAPAVSPPAEARNQDQSRRTGLEG